MPGRRKDGTFAGKRLVRRFFWNILRGTTGGIASVALSIMGGEIVSVFGRTGKVTGPADAQALALVDAVRPAKAAWLVYSETRIGLVETGPVFYDPADNPKPVFLWQAAAPEAPAHLPRKRRLRWPDGSTFDYGIGN